MCVLHKYVCNLNAKSFFGTKALRKAYLIYIDFQFNIHKTFIIIIKISHL